MIWMKKKSAITAIIMSMLFVCIGLAAENESPTNSKDKGVQSDTSQNQPSQEQAEDQSQEQCTGKILKQKIVTIKGKNQNNQVVLIQTKDDGNVVVDLGPSQNLSSIELKTGQDITVKGQIVRIGDRKVLFAKHVTINGQKIQIRRMFEKAQLMRKIRAIKRDAGSLFADRQNMRKMQDLSGTISKTMEVTVKNTGKQNTIALIKKSDGQMMVADLGPSDKLSGLDLKADSAVSLKGRWVRVGDQPVLLTCELTMGSQKTTIEHPIGEILNQATKSISGQIIRAKDVSIKGTQINNRVVMLKTKNDQQVLVDLGPTKNLSDVKIETGKQLEVQGWPIRIGDHLVLLSQKFTCDGKTIETHRLENLKQMRQNRDAGTDQSIWGQEQDSGAESQTESLKDSAKDTAEQSEQDKAEQSPETSE